MSATTRTPALLALLFSTVLSGCAEPDDKASPSADDTAAPDTTDTGTAEVVDTDTDTGTGVVDTAPPEDTAPPIDTDTGEPPVSPVSAVSARINDHVVTLVEVTFTLDAPADSVQIGWVTDKRGHGTTPARALEAGEHTEVVLGVGADTSLSVTVLSTVGDNTFTADGVKVTTGSLPSDLEAPALVTWDKSVSQDSWLLTSVEVGRNNFFGPYYAVIVDRSGEIIWYREHEDNRLTMFPRVSRDGTHVLVDTTSIYVGGTAELHKLTLDHRQQEASAPPLWTLTYDVLPDGTMLYDENPRGNQFYLSALYPDGTSEQLWDCTAWMETIQTVNFWDCMPNTITWNEDTNTVLWSMFETSTVIELDLDTMEVIRQFGAMDGSWEFSPADAGFNLQHFPSYTDDGTLIVSTHQVSGPGRRQYAREYALDDATQTLEQIWSFENDLGYYAQYAGEAKRLPDGNTLVGFGTAGALLEVDPAGEVLWGVEWPGKLIGQATVVEDLYALNEGW